MVALGDRGRKAVTGCRDRRRSRKGQSLCDATHAATRVIVSGGPRVARLWRVAIAQIRAPCASAECVARVRATRAAWRAVIDAADEAPDRLEISFANTIYGYDITCQSSSLSEDNVVSAVDRVMSDWYCASRWATRSAPSTAEPDNSFAAVGARDGPQRAHKERRRHLGLEVKP